MDTDGMKPCPVCGKRYRRSVADHIQEIEHGHKLFELYGQVMVYDLSTRKPTWPKARKAKVLG